MIKQAMADAGLELLAVGGLLTFVAVFLGVTAWALTRRRKQVDAWSSLPLADDDDDPVQPRSPIDNHAGGPDRAHGAGGCGRCERCECREPGLVTVTTLAMN